MKFEKKGQVAVFVIIALVIVGGIITFFVFREQLFGQTISSEFRPAFDYYKSCIESEARAAIDLAGSQGGRVSTGDYIPGSEYAPFSSQLNFLGFPVPYWYYLSGNGLAKENVPSKIDIQNDIAQYIDSRVNANCNFDDFYSQGYEINLSVPSTKVTINDAAVSVVVNSNVVVAKGEGSARLSTHSVDIISNFGKLYNTAREIYAREKSTAFLENYSVDVLRTYAPVDGVEIGCSGKVWKTGEVIDELKSALEANIAAIRFKGDYYTSTNENKYFVVDLPVGQQINLVYSKEWSTKVEIGGADDELMSAEPVGTQEGLGVMGFCYSPYHFVYDISYPVLIQVLDGNEIFQFPVVVVIDKNLPREGIYSEVPNEEDSLDACQYHTQEVSVNVYDNQLGKVDANLSLICLNQNCKIGSTVDGVFNGNAPACLNGYLKASATGFADKKQIFSTNDESHADVILDREYDVDLSIESSGKAITDNALIIFNGGRTVSAMLPEVSQVKLSEGFYNVSVYVYSNTSLSIPGTTKRQCTEVPKGAIGGFFGLTEEKCYDIEIPETKIESALVGGGKSEIYLLPGDIQDGKLILEVDELPKPTSFDGLQSNYQLFETLKVGVVA